MKTKRIVALALAGALALGGALATPVLADEAKQVQAAVSAEEYLATYAVTQARLATNKKNADAAVEKLTKSIKDQNKLKNDAKKEYDEAVKAYNAAYTAYQEKMDETKAAKDAKDAAQEDLDDALAQYGLAKADKASISAAKKALKAYINANKNSTDPAVKAEVKKKQDLLNELNDQATVDKILALPKAVEDAQKALDKAKKEEGRAKVANDNAKNNYDATKSAFEEAKAPLKGMKEDLKKAEDNAKVAQDLIDNFGLISSDLDALVKQGYKFGNKSAKQILEQVFRDKSQDEALTAEFVKVMGGDVTPAPNPDQKPDDQKPEVKPGTPEVKPGKPEVKPGQTGKDNKKDNKKAPKTGDITVLAYAGSAVLAAGAFVASKKRK